MDGTCGMSRGFFVLSSRRRHTRCALVTGVQTCALPISEPALQHVIEMGCWTPVQTTGAGGQWQVKLLKDDGSQFEVMFEGVAQGVVDWDMTGQQIGRASCRERVCQYV